MKNNIYIFLVVAHFGYATAFAAPNAWIGDNQFSLSTGLDYSYGNYSSANVTDMQSFLASGENETDQWMFKVTSPYVQISDKDVLAPVNGRIRAGGATRELQYGLGTTVALASYNIYSGRTPTFGIDFTGKIKLNSADAGLGSVQNNYAAQADAYQNFNKFTAIGSLGYKVQGNPAKYSLNNFIYGSFGGTYQLDEQMNGGIDLSLSQSPSATSAGQRELTAYVSRKINRNLKAKGYVLKGFSNSSQDNSLGAQIYYGF